jgi:YkoY family integral membrane protein
LLSVDNAAVLATMVMDLPQKQRERALKIGLVFAYIFRGLAMLFASFLIQFWYLKTIGGAYLLYLVYSWWRGKQTPKHEDDLIDKKSNWFYRMTVGRLGTFWGTVMMVELMDMTFSIDNVFAAVAFTPNILLVCFGVFIGILAMRFIAQRFVTLMGKYPFLEPAAFIVIGILGLKLTLSIVEHYYPDSAFTHFMESHTVNMVLSLLTVAIFFLPILTSNLFNFPKKAK